MSGRGRSHRLVSARQEVRITLESQRLGAMECQHCLHQGRSGSQTVLDESNELRWLFNHQHFPLPFDAEYEGRDAMICHSLDFDEVEPDVQMANEFGS